MMRKVLSILLVCIMLSGCITTAFAGTSTGFMLLDEGQEESAAEKYVAYAGTLLGKTGTELFSEYGINYGFEWCVWFTTLCAYQTGFCSSATDKTYNVFPPFSQYTWSGCGWAATGVTYQVNWFAKNDKGTVYKFITEDTVIHALYRESIMCGDVNADGIVNTGDAVIVLKFSAGMIQLDDLQQTAADTNHEGNVNTADAVLILKYSAGMVTEF